MFGLDFCDKVSSPFNAHPTDCTKFVVCENGIAHIITCEADYFWDNTLQGCNERFLVPCIHDKLPIIPSAAPVTQPPTTAAPTTQPPTTAPPTTVEKVVKAEFVLPAGKNYFARSNIDELFFISVYGPSWYMLLSFITI